MKNQAIVVVFTNANTLLGKNPSESLEFDKVDKYLEEGYEVKEIQVTQIGSSNLGVVHTITLEKTIQPRRIKPQSGVV